MITYKCLDRDGKPKVEINDAGWMYISTDSSFYFHNTDDMITMRTGVVITNHQDYAIIANIIDRDLLRHTRLLSAYMMPHGAHAGEIVLELMPTECFQFKLNTDGAPVIAHNATTSTDNNYYVSDREFVTQVMLQTDPHPIIINGKNQMRTMLAVQFIKTDRDIRPDLSEIL